MIGLKIGTVQLFEHDKNWELEAQKTIAKLKEILGDVIKDIQHIGSTSIVTIKAKPIIDIAIAVDDFDDILQFENKLKKEGFYYRPSKTKLTNQLLFASGSYYDNTGDNQTHFIHIVKTGSMDWLNYINFRDYLNSKPSVAKEYENLKLVLSSKTTIDIGREEYTKGKHNFITHTLRKALVYSYLGKIVNIKIDRPMGSIHPKHTDITYSLNYGFIPNVFSQDNEELDVYLLGVNVPVEEFKAKIIAIIHRYNDIEDKLVAAPEGMIFTKKEIEEAVKFQEKYYKTEIELLP